MALGFVQKRMAGLEKPVPRGLGYGCELEACYQPEPVSLGLVLY